jgi:hypothetical protein
MCGTGSNIWPALLPFQFKIWNSNTGGLNINTILQPINKIAVYSDNNSVIPETTCLRTLYSNAGVLNLGPAAVLYDVRVHFS